MIEVFVDGSARGQGVDIEDPRGDAAIGIVIYRNQKLIGSFARGLGRRTNNEAEYEAVIHAVLMCWAADLYDPIIYCDSLTTVNQVNGISACRADSLIPLLATVKELQSVFRFRLQYVPRKYVHEADTLAKNFLDQLFM